MKKMLIIIFSIMVFVPLMARADMTDISDPMSPLNPLNPTNPLNPISPWNRYYNPVSPYYVGNDDTTTVVDNGSRRGAVIIVGKKDRLRKIKAYYTCTENEGGNACLNLLK